jgi:hypothetical protein
MHPVMVPSFLGLSAVMLSPGTSLMLTVLSVIVVAMTAISVSPMRPLAFLAPLLTFVVVRGLLVGLRLVVILGEQRDHAHPRADRLLEDGRIGIARHGTTAAGREESARHDQRWHDEPGVDSGHEKPPGMRTLDGKPLWRRPPIGVAGILSPS